MIYNSVKVLSWYESVMRYSISQFVHTMLHQVIFCHGRWANVTEILPNEWLP